MDYKSLLAELNCYKRECWRHLLYFTHFQHCSSCTEMDATN